MPKREKKFGIDFVLEMDYPDLPKKLTRNGNALDMRCPFCGREGKLHVDLTKDVYRCNACSSTDERASGGMVKLHRLANGFADDREAGRDLGERFRSLSPEKKASAEKKQAQILENAFTQKSVRPLDVRDAFYRALLSALKLDKVDKEDLFRRGLSEAQIAEGMYKSTPSTRRKAQEAAIIALQTIDPRPDVIERWAKMSENGSGIPGLFFKDGMPDITFSGAGYFVPVRTREGLISGMQIRLRKPLKKQKYIWFSSSAEKTGCSVTGAEQIHYTGFDKASKTKSVWLTEGPLKADIASAYSGRAFMALIGVNNTSQLKKAFQQLKADGIRTLVLAIDMDRFTNKNVKNAFKNIMKIASQVGFESAESFGKAIEMTQTGKSACVPIEWSPEYKGIDDYFAAAARQQ